MTWIPPDAPSVQLRQFGLLCITIALAWRFGPSALIVVGIGYSILGVLPWPEDK